MTPRLPGFGHHGAPVAIPFLLGGSILPRVDFSAEDYFAWRPWVRPGDRGAVNHLREVSGKNRRALRCRRPLDRNCRPWVSCERGGGIRVAGSSGVR